MSLQQRTVADRILKAVRRAPGCELDDLEPGLPGLTWNQVFLEIDSLSRTGQVHLTAKGLGVYTVRLPTKESHSRPKWREAIPTPLTECPCLI